MPRLAPDGYLGLLSKSPFPHKSICIIGSSFLTEMRGAMRFNMMRDTIEISFRREALYGRTLREQIKDTPDITCPSPPPGRTALHIIKSD